MTLTTDRFHVETSLGRTRSLTREGFLICEYVPISRLGTLIYVRGEVPVDAGSDGLIRIERDESALFAESAIHSFEGKPVTNNHPPEEVNPENYRQYAIGHVQNLRRGDGIDNDLLIGDFVITDKDAIQEILDGKWEVSAGYDADYEQLTVGRGRQHNIIGNHVAIVENGRCGSRCSIQDKEPEAMNMKLSWSERLRNAFKTSDASAFDTALSEITGDVATSPAPTDKGTNVTVHIHGAPTKTKDAEGEEDKDENDEKKTEDESSPLDAIMSKLESIEGRLDKLEGKTKDAEGEEEEDDKKKKTENAEGDDDEDDKTKDAEGEEDKDDDKKTQDSLSAVIALAEIVSPGIRLPTKDAKGDVKKSIVDLQRRSLLAAIKTDKGAEIIKPLLGSRDIAKLTTDGLDMLFNASAASFRTENNKTSIKVDVSAAQRAHKEVVDINKRNAEFWAARRAQ